MSSCANVGYVFYNITGSIVNDTLYENGKYEVYVNGILQNVNSDNTYKANFTRINRNFENQ